MKKNELAGVLNDTLEVVAYLIEGTDAIRKALIAVPPIIGAVRTLFDIPDEPEEAPAEKPKKVKKKEPEPQPELEEPAEQEAPAEEKTYTKAEVRQFLAKVADGHRDEVKALLTKYGADTLTQLDESHYADIMSDAEAIANG